MLKVTNVYLVKFEGGYYRGSSSEEGKFDSVLSNNIDDAVVFHSEKSAKAFAEANEKTLGEYTIVAKLREIIS